MENSYCRNKDSFTIRRFKIIDEVINTAIANGNIIIPEDEFDAGFDHLTPIVRSEDIESKADPNYYLKRGYPGNVNSLSGKHSKPDSDNPPTAKETFIGYLQIAMRHTKEEREVMFPSATYPFLSTKFDFVTNYLKNIILIWKLSPKDRKIGILNLIRNYRKLMKEMAMMMILGETGEIGKETLP